MSDDDRNVLSMLPGLLQGIRDDINRGLADVRAEVSGVRTDMVTGFAVVHADMTGIREALAGIAAFIDGTVNNRISLLERRMDEIEARQ